MKPPLSLLAFVVCVAFTTVTVAEQRIGQKEEFRAIALVNNNLGSGTGRVIIRVTRWSSNEERNLLATTLLDRGAANLLEVLRNAKPVGTIRTPDSIGYDLRYARQTPTDEGGRQIVVATDRPISFWEARNRPRVSDYPFTLIQMQLNRFGKGTGTLSYATKITVKDKNTIELENFGSSPAMLTEIEARPIR